MTDGSVSLYASKPNCARVCACLLSLDASITRIAPSSSNDDVWPQIRKGQKESALFATQMFSLIHSLYIWTVEFQGNHMHFHILDTVHTIHKHCIRLRRGKNTLAFTSVVACLLRTGVRAVCISRPASWFCIAVCGSAWDRSSRRSTSLFKAGNFSLGVIESTESLFSWFSCLCLGKQTDAGRTFISWEESSRRLWGQKNVVLPFRTYRSSFFWFRE